MAESDQVHNYAYPAVASWLHSTSLAQLDGPSDPRNADDPLDASPDDFYKSAFTTTTTTTQHDIAPPPADMAATRQRQPVANGAARPPPRSAPRCVSGPAPSTLSTAPGHASPPVSNKVKALAERFEQSPGAAAPAVRSRSKGPGRVGGYNPARHSNASASASASSTASAPRPSKEAQYGSYTLNTLKPRERPQPAPATPRNAPNTRRTTGSRSSLHHHASPSRNKAVASPTRKPASSGRQLFFGEVVSGQDVAAPGFGIPTHQSLEEEIPGVGIILKSAARRERLPAATFKPPHHERSRSVATSTPSQRDIERASVRPSPASKIPVRRRRLSATSDTTSSSTRSVRYTPTRASNHSHRASPTRSRRKLLGAAPTADLHGADQSILPPLAYRGYRERRKSLAGPRGGPAIASDPPLSPRLPKSREREFLQPSPGQSTRASDAYGDHGYFPNEPLDPSVDSSTGPQEFAIQSSHQKDDPYAHPHPTNHHSEQPAHEEHQNSSSGHQQRLSLQTGQLSLPPPQQQPLSATTDFEESPILGVPGSFVLTPPTGHEEQHPQPLQPTVVYPSSRKQAPTSPEIEQSELGVRESIPIMLSNEQSSQPRHSGSEAMGESLQALTYGYPMDRSYGIDGMQPASHYHRDDSPIDPFGNRDSLQPEDSASSAPCRAAAPIAFNTETYSVVNSVLNMYHQSPVISPELASVSRQRVHKVSPVIAQHKDWGSKEATETYLARLLSDANGGAGEQVSRTQRMTSPSRPAVTVPHAEEAPGIDAGGTAIIYPPQSRRYSRGSRGSTTTTIQDDASRSGSSSGLPSQNHTMHSATTDPFSNNGIELPQLAWTNGGLGLSYDEDLPPSPSSQQAPPRPAYSPPPPPMSPSSDQHTTPLDTTQPPFSHQYPRPTAINEHIDLHPARAPAPGSLPNELGLEARYGSPAMEDVDQAIAPRASVDHGQPDLAKQALIKRYRILEELLTTEHQFCIDMMIAHNIFEATAQSVMTEKEKKVLFSNCKELEKFSLSLFRAFKKAAKPIVKYDIPPPTGPWNRDSTDSRPSNSDAPLNIRRPSEDLQNQFENCTPENDHLTAVGQVFLENKEKMERLYTTYFLNQENAAAYIKKHQSNTELVGWVAACFEQVEKMTQAWDLNSLLLKPCQRLLKYPLLIEGLIKSSDPDHPDLHHLSQAHDELKLINNRINDAKKRADTFRAATSEGKKEKTKGKGIGKTFVKAFIPKVDKNKAYDEADKTFKDQDYKSREQKFGGHFFQLQIVIRDFEQYLDAITEHYAQLNIVFIGFVSVCEVAPSVHPELESTWRKWAMAHFELQNKALEDHKTAVRTRVLKPVADLWEMWVAYQKTIEQRKKYLLYYVKHKQAVDRGEKVDPDLEESAKKFTTINDTLKHELPLLYERTKGLMRTLMTLFMCLQKDWYKTCSKKILPLLESEPQHTTSLRYDLESYVERFHSDYKPLQDLANRLGIVNRNLLIDISNMASPVPTMSSDGGGSSRNSSSRRTESIGSEASIMDSRNRHSGGYSGAHRARMYENPPRSLPAGPAYPSLYPNGAGRPGPGPTSLREARALSPVSDDSEATVIHHRERRNTASSRNQNFLGLDGAVDFDDRMPFGSNNFDFPPQLGPSFLAASSQPMAHSMSAPMTQSQPISLPGSHRGSGIFNSALPMSDAPTRGSVEEFPATPCETDEPEVLFLAASLFEFNIAHDRREGGIPYLVYVPGEIFDVIGMKGELWLARNQDDTTKTVGWIWEKHFARILPEDA